MSSENNLQPNFYYYYITTSIQKFFYTKSSITSEIYHFDHLKKSSNVRIHVTFQFLLLLIGCSLLRIKRCSHLFVCLYVAAQVNERCVVDKVCFTLIRIGKGGWREKSQHAEEKMGMRFPHPLPLFLRRIRIRPSYQTTRLQIYSRKYRGMGKIILSQPKTFPRKYLRNKSNQRNYRYMKVYTWMFIIIIILVKMQNIFRLNILLVLYLN